MGEAQNAQNWLFQPEFNRAVKVRTTDERITSDAGLLLLREVDHRLGLTESLAEQLIDPRRPDRIRYELVELLRERLYGLAMGYSTLARRRPAGPRSGHEAGRLEPARRGDDQ